MFRRNKKDTLNIVTIGHVDHGKSTLIGRLLVETGSLPKEKTAEINRISRELGKDAELAYITDQLKEEREKNITIDTTQIFFNSRKRNYVIIDAPGHVEFLKNMITGASQARAAVLLVDAAEGIREQTKRHAYIIRLLGISRVIVLCNKMDAVQYDRNTFEQLKTGLETTLEHLAIKPLRIIPVSALEGDNIKNASRNMRWYTGPSFLKALDAIRLPSAESGKPLRFAVQDMYRVNGERVAAGKVVSGTITENLQTVLFPALSETTVKQVKVFGEDTRKSASAGENIGVILDTPLEIKRGDFLVDRKTDPQSSFTTEVFWMAHEPLRIGATYTLRCSTQEAACKPVKIGNKIDSSTFEMVAKNAEELNLNEAAEVTFQTDRPLIMENFEYIDELGRFIIERDYNPLGAGIKKHLKDF